MTVVKGDGSDGASTNPLYASGIPLRPEVAETNCTVIISDMGSPAGPAAATVLPTAAEVEAAIAAISSTLVVRMDGDKLGR